MAVRTRMLLASLTLPALSACTAGGGGSGVAADCMALTTELAKLERPAALVSAADGMCRPKQWAEDEVAEDLVVADGTAWLASGACVNFEARVWRSDDGGEVWEETGNLGTGLHCSAGSGMKLSVQDADTAEVTVDHGAVIETRTVRTENAGRSWKLVRLRCLDSDDPKACG